MTFRCGWGEKLEENVRRYLDEWHETQWNHLTEQIPPNLRKLEFVFGSKENARAKGHCRTCSKRLQAVIHSEHASDFFQEASIRSARHSSLRTTPCMLAPC